MDLRTVIVVGGIALMAWGTLRIVRGRRDWSRDRLVHEMIGVGMVGSIVLGSALQTSWPYLLTLVLAILSLVFRRRLHQG